MFFMLVGNVPHKYYLGVEFAMTQDTSNENLLLVQLLKTIKPELTEEQIESVIGIIKTLCPLCWDEPLGCNCWTTVGKLPLTKKEGK